jgi:peptidoglycan/LPS O-acetylase OafA/YrhL
VHATPATSASRAAHAAPRAAAPTIGANFDSRHNSLNFLRLVLATVVIVAHTWPVGGYGPDPVAWHYNYGTIAVAGFFAISGYLIAGSRLHNSGPRFLVRRIMRIYPGFIICLIVTAVVFAPLATVLGPGHYDGHSALSYVRRDLLLKMNQYDIRATLDSVPYPRVWDGSLWTLRYEFLCYVIIGLLLTVPRFRREIVIALFLLGAGVSTYCTVSDTRGTIFEASRLIAIFAAGSLVALYADRIRLDWRLAVLSAVVIVASVRLDCMHTVGALPICYLLLWLGYVLPLQRVGRKNDVSYGVYIYGMPIQQTLVLMGLDSVNPWVFVLVAVACSLVLAAISWFVVERRALLLVPAIDRLLLRHRDPAGERRPGVMAAWAVVVIVAAAMTLYPVMGIAREVAHNVLG